jgi:ketosteroid isomerase-like protein
MRILLAAAACVLIVTAASAHPDQVHDAATKPVAGVAVSARPPAAVVDAFHAALRRGDTNTAQSHLAANALIYESGGVERDRKEYASHHLGADAAFAQAVPGTVIRRTGEAVGAVAWIATEGRTTGTYNDKAIDRITTETMLLRRVGGAWKIVHIHWSSAAAAR